MIRVSHSVFATPKHLAFRQLKKSVSSVYSVDFFWGSLKARCFVVTQHSESRVSHSVFATPKHLAERQLKI